MWRKLILLLHQLTPIGQSATESRDDQIAQCTEANNNLRSPNILILNIDCLEELFDWLSLRDLRTLRATCKRMKKAVDYYIRATYPCGFGYLQLREINCQEIQQIDASICKLYKHIEFDCKGPMSVKLIQNSKSILNDIERISIISKEATRDFCDKLLDFSQNLKFFNIPFFETVRTSIGLRWLHYTYPRLEHVAFSDGYFDSTALEIPQLQILFEQNPNIRRFSTDAKFMLANRKWMLASKIRFDQLDVVVYRSVRFDLAMVYDLWNELFKCGFYKKLHFFIVYIENHNSVAGIASLRALEKLYINGLDNLASKEIVWPPMPQLKEFCAEEQSIFQNGCHINVNKFVECAVNIERIGVACAAFQVLLPFFHRSLKLKKVRIHHVYCDTFCDKGVIDLFSLNAERQKCENPSKVTIYVEENIYLKTKEALMNTSFECVELKRIQSYEWDVEVF